MDLGVTGVSELVLEVADLEAAERFYADVLGLPVVERWPDREAIWVMAGDRTRIGLWRPQGGVPTSTTSTTGSVRPHGRAVAVAPAHQRATTRLARAGRWLSASRPARSWSARGGCT